MTVHLSVLFVSKITQILLVFLEKEREVGSLSKIGPIKF